MVNVLLPECQVLRWSRMCPGRMSSHYPSRPASSRILMLEHADTQRACGFQLRPPRSRLVWISVFAEMTFADGIWIKNRAFDLGSALQAGRRNDQTIPLRLIDKRAAQIGEKTFRASLRLSFLMTRSDRKTGSLARVRSCQKALRIRVLQIDICSTVSWRACCQTVS